MGLKEDYRGPTGRVLPGLKLELSEAISRLEQLFAAQEVILAYLFGSYAEGSATEASDLDLAVLLPGHEAASAEHYLELITLINHTIETERFDLLLLNSASPLVINEVLRSGLVIYARSEAELDHFRLQASQKYLDTAHLRNVQNAYLKERVERWYSEKKAFSKDRINNSDWTVL